MVDQEKNNHHDRMRHRGIRASRARLQKALSESDLEQKTQVALANRIADEEGLDAAPKDLVNKVFRERPVDPQTLGRVARALRVDIDSLYLPDQDPPPPPRQETTTGRHTRVVSFTFAGLLIALLLFWMIPGRPDLVCRITEAWTPLSTAEGRLGVIIARFANDSDNRAQDRLAANFLDDPKLSPYVTLLQSCRRPTLAGTGDITARLQDIRREGQETLRESGAHILLWGTRNGDQLRVRFISNRSDVSPLSLDIGGRPTQISEAHLEIPLELTRPEATLPDIKKLALDLITSDDPALLDLRRQAVRAYHTSMDWLRASILSDRNVKRTLDRTLNPQLWAMINGQLCYKQRLLGDYDAEHAHYKDAESSCREALTVRDRARYPRDWASLKINLASALMRLHLYADSPQETRDYLLQAEAAMTEAGEIVDREALPQLWALHQRNLGAIYMRLGEISPPEEADFYFDKGLDRMRAALELLQPAQQPVDWALTQQNICASLYRKGFNQGAEGLPLVYLAIDHCREALRWLDPEKTPLTWAMVQNNLAVSQAIFSQLEQKPEELSRAIAEFRKAQTIYTRERFPANWAEVEINLGELNCNLAVLRRDPGYLGRATAHAEQALEVLMQKKIGRYQRYLESQLKNYRRCAQADISTCECSPG